MSAVLIEGPDYGTLSLQANGAFQYTPNADFAGFDYFKYRVTDGVRISYNAYVQLNVQRVIDNEVVARDDDTHPIPRERTPHRNELVALGMRSGAEAWMMHVRDNKPALIFWEAIVETMI